MIDHFGLRVRVNYRFENLSKYSFLDQRQMEIFYFVSVRENKVIPLLPFLTVS